MTADKICPVPPETLVRHQKRSESSSGSRSTVRGACCGGGGSGKARPSSNTGKRLVHGSRLEAETVLSSGRTSKRRRRCTDTTVAFDDSVTRAASSRVQASSRPHALHFLGAHVAFRWTGWRRLLLGAAPIRSKPSLADVQGVRSCAPTQRMAFVLSRAVIARPVSNTELGNRHVM